MKKEHVLIEAAISGDWNVIKNESDTILNKKEHVC